MRRASAAGRMILRFSPADRDDQLVADLLQVDLALVGEGDRDPQRRGPVRRLSTWASWAVQDAARRLRARCSASNSSSPSRSSIRAPTTSSSKKRAVSTGTGAKPSRTCSSVPALVARARRRSSRPATLVGEDPVDDHGVGQVAVEVEVGEGALGLLDHHPVGVHHQPDRGARRGRGGSRSSSIRLRTSRWTSANTSSPGSGTSSSVLASGRAALDQAPLPGEDLLEPPAGDVGEAQQAQGLAGRRAVDDHDVELARLVVALYLQQARRARPCPAARSAPRRGPARPRGRRAAPPSQSWTRRQLDSISRWARTSWPTGARRPASARGRGRPRASPRGCGRGRSRGRPCAGRRAQRAGAGGGDAGLAHAALAGVEDRPRPHRPMSLMPLGQAAFYA